ncbi:MAG: VWA domain-containing protein [Propionibacteriaceae bacterium]|jgi:hypothetical protein|nr:VWA domain-containing protein [Propionibacteriaceae bacterium]
MAQFNATVYQNEFLMDGSTDVNAIVSITCHDAGKAGQTGAGDAGELIIVDTSASMGRINMDAAKQAAMVAVDTILDGTYFAVIAGNHHAYLAYPRVNHGPGMVRMDATTRQAAKQAIASFRADGGTAMGSWLLLAKALFHSIPALVGKHAILLTDGENHNESTEQLAAALRSCQGQFQVDCRGIGVDWQVPQLRQIATMMMGSVDLIPSPRDLPRVFHDLISSSMGRGVPQADLRLWMPQGAQLLFIRQVSPTVEDLTHRAQTIGELTQLFSTGSWGDETRDYHIAIRLPARSVGTEQLAARLQLCVGPTVLAQGLIKAKWSTDSRLTTVINPEVAHYTGQTELATAIQDGLAARSAGDWGTATTKLGRAVALANASGNHEVADRLSKVVDVADAATGRVVLKPNVDKADEMALDTASTRTTRIRG